METIKIRERNRQAYSREADGHDRWTEFQVVEGRKVLGRYELLSQAERAVSEILKKREANS